MYRHMQPLGLGPPPLPPHFQFNLSELENCSSRVNFAGFSFNLELYSD